MPEGTIDDCVDEMPASSRKEHKTPVDTIANITYSLAVGGALDYACGLYPLGILASRASATAMNAATGGIYGRWREIVYRTVRPLETSGHARKSITMTVADLIAFNTFQVPLYGIGLAVGSFISEGHVNMEKVWTGMSFLASISPLIAPTLGWYTDGLRKLFIVKGAAHCTESDGTSSTTKF